MNYLQEALSYYNTEIHQWYGWKDLEAGEVYSNIKLNDENAVMPTEEEVNTKIAELQFVNDRATNYPSLVEFAEAYTEKEILNDSTKWDAYVEKYNQVRTDYPKS